MKEAIEPDALNLPRPRQRAAGCALLHELIGQWAQSDPAKPALFYKGDAMTYGALADEVEIVARGLAEIGLVSGDRVAVYLEKRCETVVAQFAAAAGGGMFVPINPLLKSRQVGHILGHSGARFLITSRMRLKSIAPVLEACPELEKIVLIDPEGDDPSSENVDCLGWQDLRAAGMRSAQQLPKIIDSDPAAILFTSGSTGRPKGVVISHRNLVSAARSAAEHLGNTGSDRILCVLPFSFDYGLVQLTSAFNVGASVVLINYLFPQDVIRAVVAEEITGLAGVPPLWIQLSRLDWPEQASKHLRYITNSGGVLSVATQRTLRAALPGTDLHLMYGLTEAFRSTSLPPSELDNRPTSIGKPIPNADVLIVREDGTPCEPFEHGQLVHRGAFVTLGYWNDPDRTAERFRPAPGPAIGGGGGVSVTETAVWTGDVAWFDDEGFFHFVGREDDQIKTSGFRVSPTEIEEVLYETGLIGEAVAFGVPHAELGQAIVAVVTSPGDGPVDIAALTKKLSDELPKYMVPLRFEEKSSLPRTPNGKMDRKSLAAEFADIFADGS